MRKMIGVFFAALVLGALCAGGASAASLGVGQAPGVADAGGMLTRVDYDSSCRHLRHACREEREEGYEGRACDEYRQECGGWRHCRRVRHDCHEERERGDEGPACEHYYDECR